MNVLINMVCDLAGVPYQHFFDRCAEEQKRLLETSKDAEALAVEAEKGSIVEVFGGDRGA